MENKRGQGLSTSAIILIVLGVLVLIILAIGFIAGWDTFGDWLKPKENNVDTVVRACEAECSVRGDYGYCSESRRLMASDLPGDVEFVENTCNYFATEAEYLKYGIAECQYITCP